MRFVVASGLALLGLAASALCVGAAKSRRLVDAAIHKMQDFCGTHGRLPGPAEFEETSPEIADRREWYYWPSDDRERAALQFPVTFLMKDAPGAAKSSEFTGLIYAHVVSVECPLATVNADAADSIEDPYAFVWSNEGSVSGMIRFFADLDMDGLPEIFVGAIALIGNGGGEFMIFKKLDRAGYANLGTVFLHPNAFQILPTASGGFADLRYCAAVDAEHCALATYVFDGRRYQALQSTVIRTGERPAEPPYFKAPVEESGLILNWTP